MREEIASVTSKSLAKLRPVWDTRIDMKDWEWVEGMKRDNRRRYMVVVDMGFFLQREKDRERG